MYLLEAFIKFGFCPQVLRSGRKINLLGLQEINLRIISTNFYFSGNEYQIADMFEVQYNRVYFPSKFFKPNNFSYIGRIPPIEAFLDEFDCEKDSNLKCDFHSDFQKYNKIWSFKREFLSYCDQKLILLTVSAIKFMQESFYFQSLLQNSKGVRQVQYVNPFGSPVCTIGGFIYLLFRKHCLNDYDIYSIKHEFGFPQRKISQVEYDWASLMCYKYPEKEFLSALNNENGQKFFKETIPDLYSEITKEAWYLNECFIHAHCQDCKLFPNAKLDNLTPWGKTYQEVNEQFSNKTLSLMLNHPEISEVKVEWECNFKTKTMKTLESEIFFKKYYKPHPLVRLRSRDCFRGAFFEVFAHIWSKKLYPNETLYFVDINGLYSFCALTFKFMTGKYDILLGDKLNNIKISNNSFTYFSKPISGTVLITILPPKKLKYPFLLYKTKLGHTVLTLCRTCSEHHSLKCNHTDDQRALTGSYLISEIQYSLNLGYKIQYIHECHAYEKCDYVFKYFVEALNFMKTKSSVKLSDVNLDLCDALNVHQTTPSFQFKAADFQKNVAKKQFYKLAANSLFGKVAQKNNKSRLDYVNSQEELEKLYFSENVIEDIFCLNENICQVFVKPNEKKLPTNRNSNCYIGAQMTAFAREVLYNYLLQIINCAQSTVYYVDCDSIVFSLPTNVNIPLPISIKCGDFKHEYEEISAFYCLSPKSYFVQSKNGTVSKIKGLSINHCKDIFTEELFEKFIKALVINKPLSLKVEQRRYYANFKLCKVLEKIQKVSFTNFTNKRRVTIVDSCRLESIPFGYNN